MLWFSFNSLILALRSTGSWEAVSYILLLGVAMPLKYLADWPLGVQVVGLLHGILWTLYVGLAVLGQFKYRWQTSITGWLIVASLLPFGPIIADARLLRRFS
jgi:integral membrane protein